MIEPSRRRTTRRIVLIKPHRMQRDPGDQAMVWRQRRRSFGITAVAWLFLAVAGAMSSWGTAFIALASAAAVLSAAVVVKAEVLVRRAEERLRAE